VKDEGEIATLREAGRRLSQVARTAREWLVPGRSEREVAAGIDRRLRDAGFERTAFETIVASGPNGALPHARPTARRLAVGDGVVLDFGGVYDGYCVDLTRTLHIGPMPPQFRRLFEAVRDAQAAAIAVVKPGVSAADIDREARQVLERRGLGEAFGHGTGHGLGLEVHEAPRISSAASHEERVVPGMVFTIEPGAYVPGVGGVRIEDDILVTGDGCELLTDVPIDF
jgi:Xaa-Pro aminopeptidase